VIEIISMLALVAELAANREYLGGVANPTCRWLFPGRRPGQPLTYQALLRRLRQLGFPLQQARASAVRELVLQVPAPVVADALGFHQTTTARQAANVGSTWSRYRSGNKPRDALAWRGGRLVLDAAGGI
jgi:hypothetical protein